MIDAKWIQTEYWFSFCQNYCNLIFFPSSLLLIVSLFFGLFIAPVDFQQGDVYRIIFVHVPCAAVSLCFYSFVGLCSLLYITSRINLFDIMALSFAKVGVIFTFLSLFTGAIWGQPTWGTYWVWDARLTSQLLLLGIYVAYISGRGCSNPSKQLKIYMSVFAVMGLVDLPIIHFSVNWWQTLHQPPSLFKFAYPSIAPEILWILMYSLISFFAIAFSFFLLTLRTELFVYCEHKRWLKKCLESAIV